MQLGITTLVREGTGKGKGIFMVQMRLSCGGVRSLVTTKIECTKKNLKGVKNFNKITSFIGEGAKNLNYQLDVEHSKVLQIFEELKKNNNCTITADMVTEIYSGRKEKSDIAQEKKAIQKAKETSIVAILTQMIEKQFAEKEIERSTYVKKIGHVHKIKLFTQSIGNEDLSYCQLTYKIYDDLIVFARTTKFANGKIIAGIETKKGNANLKLYSQLIEAGSKYGFRLDLTKTIFHPLDKFKNDSKVTDYLDAAELLLFEDFDVSKYIDGQGNYLTPDKQEKWQNVKDLFVFMCSTGFSNVDVAKFTQNKIIEKKGELWLNCQRKKTHVALLIPLYPKAKQILEKYNYLLPKVKEYSSVQNEILPLIAKFLGIEKHVTTRVARKSAAIKWWDDHNIPMQVVSKMLGHKSISTTEKYYLEMGFDMMERHTRESRKM